MSPDVFQFATAKVVDHSHRVIISQSINQMAADESGTTCN
jgi:hypothetical protein